MQQNEEFHNPQEKENFDGSKSAQQSDSVDSNAVHNIDTTTDEDTSNLSQHAVEHEDTAVLQKNPVSYTHLTLPTIYSV